MIVRKYPDQYQQISEWTHWTQWACKPPLSRKNRMQTSLNALHSVGFKPLCIFTRRRSLVRVQQSPPSWSANFDDTASNAVSSRLSGLFQLGNFFVFPLMTNAVFTQRCGLEPRQSHFMRSLKCGKHTCRMKILRFSKIKNSKLSSGYFTIQQKRGRQAVHASLPLFILLSPNY